MSKVGGWSKGKGRRKGKGKSKAAAVGMRKCREGRRRKWEKAIKKGRSDPNPERR